MKRVIKNKKKMKNTMYIVFGTFALALFAITRSNPSFANEGLIIDDALDTIAESTVVSNPSLEDEELNVEENQSSEDEDVTEPELTPDERLAEGDEIPQDLEDANLEGDNDDKEEKEDENQEDKENEEVSNEVENDENETRNEEDKETVEITEETEEPKNEDNNTNQENHGVSDENTNNGQENILPQQSEEPKFIEMNKDENIEIMSETSATLLSGADFNKKIKTLAKGSTVYDYETVDNLITGIMTGIASDSIKDENHKISMPDSEYPVYAWYDNGILYYDTQAIKIYFNADSSFMFHNLSGIVDIDFHNFDLSRVETMLSMLNGCKSLKKLDFSNMNLNSVTRFYRVTNGDNNLEEIDLSNVEMNSVTSLGYAFQSNSGLKKVNFSNAILSSVTDMDEIFCSSDNIEYVDFSNIKLQSLTSMRAFRNMSKLKKVNFHNADLRNVTTMYRAFSAIGCTLQEVDLSNVKWGSLTQIEDIFDGCNNLKEVDFSYSNLENLEKLAKYSSDISDFFSNSIEYVSFEGTNLSSLKSMQNLFKNKSLLKFVNFSGTVLNNLENLSYMFYGCSSLTGLDMSSWNMNNVTDMSSMFQGCSSLLGVDFSGKNLSNVTDMSSMFQGCSSLLGVDFSGKNLSKLNNIGNMFKGTDNLNKVDFSNTILTGLTNINYAFQNNNFREINFYNADLSNLITMNSLFYGIKELQNVDFREAKLDNVTEMYNLFSDCSNLLSVDFSGANMGRVEKIGYMFQNCSKLENVNFKNNNLNNLIYMWQIFDGCTSLTGLDLSNFNTSNVTSMNSMFRGANNLKTIYVSERFTTNNLTESGNMFTGAISLVGGNGTTYDVNHINGEYARIDTAENPGYFTNILDKPYKIIYHTNEGILSGEKTTYTQRDSFTLPVPIRTGYTFLGWTGSNGLEPEITVNIAEFTVGDLEYTANWGIGKYKIIFDTDGGNEISPIEKDYNSVINITLPTPTKECNEFSGWDTELPETMPAHDITLKATWNYTCSRSSGGGGRKSEQTTREIAIDTNTENNHNSADEKDNVEKTEQNKTVLNNETSNQVISVTQETSEDGTVEAIIETVKIKDTDIIATVRTEVSSSSSSSSATHTKEQNEAYSFAKSNGITSTSSIETAKMDTELTRIQMAKMISNYAINVLGQEPDVEKGVPDFKDVTAQMDKQYDNAVTKAYQLGIMGQNMENNKFRPEDEVTRAEFSATLSRLLYHTDEGKFRGTGKYYIPHIVKLYNEGILNKVNPILKEKRGYVMTMLMRTVQ